MGIFATRQYDLIILIISAVVWILTTLAIRSMRAADLRETRSAGNRIHRRIRSTASDNGIRVLRPIERPAAAQPGEKNE